MSRWDGVSRGFQGSWEGSREGSRGCLGGPRGCQGGAGVPGVSWESQGWSQGCLGGPKGVSRGCQGGAGVPGGGPGGPPSPLMTSWRLISLLLRARRAWGGTSSRQAGGSSSGSGSGSGSGRESGSSAWGGSEEGGGSAPPPTPPPLPPPPPPGPPGSGLRGHRARSLRERALTLTLALSGSRGGRRHSGTRRLAERPGSLGDGAGRAQRRGGRHGGARGGMRRRGDGRTRTDMHTCQDTPRTCMHRWGGKMA